MTLLELGAVAAGSSASAAAEGLTMYISWGRFGLLREIAATTALLAASGGEKINALNLYMDDGCIIA